MRESEMIRFCHVPVDTVRVQELRYHTTETVIVNVRCRYFAVAGRTLQKLTKSVLPIEVL